jgi:hypothetical protein
LLLQSEVSTIVISKQGTKRADDGGSSHPEKAVAIGSPMKLSQPVLLELQNAHEQSTFNNYSEGSPQNLASRAQKFDHLYDSF